MKINNVFKVTCPRCNNSMKYKPIKKLGIKKCVYCGKNINTNKILGLK